MTKARLTYDRPVLLVGGGALDRQTLSAAAGHAKAVVAADGGADHLLALGASAPDAIIGDMDSIGAARRWADDPEVVFHAIEEQDTTDLEKCLYSVEAPLFIAVGFFGERLDHTLAALHVATRRPEKRLIFLGSHDLCFPAPLQWRCELPERARVSIWPGSPVRGLGSTGLRWPIDGLDFAVGAQIGTSNEATGGAVELRFDRLGAMVLLEAERLELAIRSIREAEALGHYD